MTVSRSTGFRLAMFGLTCGLLFAFTGCGETAGPAPVIPGAAEASKEPNQAPGSKKKAPETLSPPPITQ